MNCSAYDSQVFVNCHSVQDIKDVINCIGGVQILFPLLEAASAHQKGSSDKTPERTYQTMKSLDASLNTSQDDWEVKKNAIFFIPPATQT